MKREKLLKHLRSLTEEVLRESEYVTKDGRRHRVYSGIHAVHSDRTASAAQSLGPPEYDPPPAAPRKKVPLSIKGRWSASAGGVKAAMRFYSFEDKANNPSGHIADLDMHSHVKALIKASEQVKEMIETGGKKIANYWGEREKYGMGQFFYGGQDPDNGIQAAMEQIKGMLENSLEVVISKVPDGTPEAKVQKLRNWIQSKIDEHYHSVVKEANLKSEQARKEIVDKLKQRFPNLFMENTAMKREDFYKQIDKQALHEKLHRVKVGERLDEFIEMKRERYLVEKIIRGKVQKLIEAKKQIRYDSTGLNVLDDMFMNSNLLSVLETEYNSLTTSQKQRDDYKSHIITSIINLFKIEDTAGARRGPEKESLAENLRRILSEQEDIEIDIEDEEEVEDEEGEEIDLNITISDEDDIPVVGPKAREEDEEEEEEDESVAPEGEESDDTGINKAKISFDKVKKNITDYYAGLGNAKDRKNFKIYLIANLELYFKSWEDEDKDNLETPTSPEIEAAVERGEQAIEAGGEDEEAPEGEEGEEELDLEL